MRHDKLKKQQAAVLALCALLSACGGGSGGFSGAACTSMASAATTTTQGNVCTEGCSYTNPDRAIDNSFSSYGELGFANASTGYANYGAKASGLSFPGGSVAGAVVNFQEDAASSSRLTVVIRTSLGGTEQERSSTFGSTTGNVFGDQQSHRLEFKTTKAFDQVELLFMRNTGTATKTVRVYEFCSS